MEEIRSDEAQPTLVNTEPSGARDIAFTLALTAPELKLTYTALRTLLDDFGREQHDVAEVIRGVLAKLPDEHSIRAITIR
jgi:hypothetical protein